MAKPTKITKRDVVFHLHVFNDGKAEVAACGLIEMFPSELAARCWIYSVARALP